MIPLIARLVSWSLLLQVVMGSNPMLSVLPVWIQ